MKKITIALILICFCIGAVYSMGKGKTVAENENTTAQETTGKAPGVIESTVINNENAVRKDDSLILTGKKDDSSISGYAPVEKVSYKVSDPDNTKGLSIEKKSHSHGPASGGKAHHTVIQFQKLFDKYEAITLDTSGEKVLYLTFDCGYEYENLTSKVLDVLKEKGVTATFFCTLDHIKKENELIGRMIKEGHIVGNHSANHPSFAGISRTKMAAEIEETENYLRENFGYAAKFFRFPAGEYNESALELIHSLGYKSVFWSVAYDDWDVKKVRGKAYATDKVMSRLHDGAVILLHSVSKDNAEALGDIIDRARAEGYRFESLLNYNR